MSALVENVVDVRDLRIEVAGRAIVAGVDLRVGPGRVTALVGASGSGKTSTGLALIGRFPAGATVTGEVRVADGRAGHVPQHPAAVLNPARRVGALLGDIARRQVRHLPRRERRAAARGRVLSALTAAQLADGAELVRRYPHQLSGGQQQRVVLAQALLLGARVIVADEPTPGLDALTKRQVVGELAALRRRGIALVLLSHDLEVVRELADEVWVMHAGRIVDGGPAGPALAHPQHPWTKELLAAAPPAPPLRPDPSRQAAAALPAGRATSTPPPTGSGPNDAAASTAPHPPRPAPRATAEGLSVRGLTAHHRATSHPNGTGRTGTPVLRDVELTVVPGECLAVVGRSGSGKTTLARCLAGLHRDATGEVLLAGRPLPRSLRDRSRAELAAVQYVFQDARAAFDPYRPVLDQVARTAVRLHGTAAGTARAQARALLAETGLAGDLVARRPAGLSGGELHRAALARALLARPRVLLCDELTAGLDPVTRRAVLDLLVGLARDRGDLALVLITHDQDTAAVADRIAVLDAGELVECGPADLLRTAPQHPRTAALLAPAPAAPAGRVSAPRP
ncbi:ATP-binding cassette domain-containing protein [Streptomyces sp. HSW2009]|uniref:ABC transporter ATP-binding protein n=1 Tax=Streptomyces sp. HSW2009 TaxID=3142890 RepID=UPI0032EDDC7F